MTGLAAAYVTPAHQHPLGHVMPAADRVALLAAAREHGAFVVEDDYDSEFRYDVAPIPALASLDRTRVAYLGTASKSVGPGLRVGWMVPPPDLLAALVEHREHTYDMPLLAGPARAARPASGGLGRQGGAHRAPGLRRPRAAGRGGPRAARDARPGRPPACTRPGCCRPPPYDARWRPRATPASTSRPLRLLPLRPDERAGRRLRRGHRRELDRALAAMVRGLVS